MILYFHKGISFAVFVILLLECPSSSALQATNTSMVQYEKCYINLNVLHQKINIVLPQYQRQLAAEREIMDLHMQLRQRIRAFVQNEASERILAEKLISFFEVYHKRAEEFNKLELGLADLSIHLQMIGPEAVQELQKCQRVNRWSVSEASREMSSSWSGDGTFLSKTTDEKMAKSYAFLQKLVTKLKSSREDWQRHVTWKNLIIKLMADLLPVLQRFIASKYTDQQTRALLQWTVMDFVHELTSYLLFHENIINQNHLIGMMLRGAIGEIKARSEKMPH